MLPHWTQQDIQVDGHKVHYYRSNDGSAAATAGKKPLVLVHGFSDTGLCWQPTAEDLEGNYDVVMPDGRGHGLSARVERGEPVDMAADLAGLIQGLALQQSVVAGHSMGAMVSAQFGARFPALARALILEDPAWFMRRGKQSPRPISEKSPMHQWIESVLAQGPEAAMAQCRAEHPEWSELTVQRWCEGKFLLDPNFFSVDNSFWGSWQDTVKAITCPVLLVTADPKKGGIITPAVARLVLQMNPGFRLAHIPGIGHHIRFGSYAAFMSAFNAFLKELG
jgi:pimeloyl-ACP methyl ester carboxylesterase